MPFFSSSVTGFIPPPSNATNSDAALPSAVKSPTTMRLSVSQ